MNRMDTRYLLADAARRARPYLPIALTVVALVVSFLLGRGTLGPHSANAQSPRAAQPARTTQPARSPVVPAGARTVATPGRSAATASQIPASAAQTPASPADPNPAVMAIVNNEQITREQLNNECLRRFGKEVLETTVNKYLIWQECQAQGIAITEQDVEDEVTRAAKKFGLSNDRWLAMLKEERDISPDQYRREIIWPTIALRRLAATQIEVTPEDVRQAFESEYGPQVRVRLIAVSSQAKADALLKEVTAQPNRFEDLAKEKSEDPNSAAARGQIPPIRRHIGDPEIERVAFSLKEGQISPVIHAANQYLILKCEKHIPESYVSSNQLPQIEGQLREQIRDNKLRAAAAELFQKMQSQAKVVNVYNNAQLAQQLPGIAATINDQKVTLQQLADECRVRHGKDVLEGEINRKLLEQELRRQNKQVSQRDIDQEVLRAAEAYGFIKPDRSPDVEGWLKAVTETENVSAELYVRDSVWPSVALKMIVGNVVQITPEDLEKGFQSNYGERVEVQAIVLNSQREANRIWEMARSNPTEEFFGQLAQQYSLEPISRSNQGKVPPIRQFGGQPVLEAEAFRLKADELSGIVAVGDKFIIMRCLGRTKPVVQDKAAVADELRRDIHEKKIRIAMAEEFDRLREAAQIHNFLAGTTQDGGHGARATASQASSAAPVTSGGRPAASTSRGTLPAKAAPPARVTR
ncbi:MAG: peptidylprolyl isomerase [Pirellulaceae bacterium]